MAAQNRLLCAVTLLLWTHLPLGLTQRISDDIIAHRRGSVSSEEYHYSPYDHYHYHEQPEPYQSYRNFRHHHPEPHHLPIFHEVPHVASIGDMYQDEPSFFPGEHLFFDPHASAVQLDNPLKKMLEPLKKQMEEHTQQMGVPGEQLAENMKDPGDELSKKKDEMMNQVGDVSTELPLPTPPGSPRIGHMKPDQGKDEKGTEDGKKDEKKEDDTNPLKKLQKKLPSGPPADIPAPPSLSIQMMDQFGRITDETTEVHDEDAPQIRRMEWAPPDFVDVPYYHHPHHDYFEYYDGRY